MDISEIEVGYKVPVKSPLNGSETIKCEIVAIKEASRAPSFYIHYCELNRRYDTWVDGKEFILGSLSEIEIPRKKKKTDEKKDIKKVEEELKVRNFEKIIIGNHSINTWYFSPYPKEVIADMVVYICEYCLFYFASQGQLNIHCGNCDLRHPPGTQIYNDEEGNISFFEVDGYKQKNYCRNLALLSKLFLDHKSLYYDVDAFLFYVLCRRERVDIGSEDAGRPDGYKIVGYFSKEKVSEQGYNLACILTLPSEQRKGYGKILIDFSYMLSRKDNLISGPEKPLSDLGLLSYRAYWLEVILSEIRKSSKINIKEMSRRTHISEDDIIGTLLANKMIKFHQDNLLILLDRRLKKKLEMDRKHRVYESKLIKEY